MAASTKLVLVVVALLMGVSILFYGVMFGGSAPLEVAAADGENAGIITPAEPPAAAEAAPPASGRPALGGASPDAARPARPALSSPRPALGAGASASSAPAPRESRGSLSGPAAGDGARRPLSAAARTAPGQIEMGAGRGALAGGTRLPAAEKTSEPPAPSAAAPANDMPRTGAEPLARPIPSRPALGSAPRTATPPATKPLAPAPTRTAAPAPDPARILTVTYSIRSGDTLSSIAAERLGAARHWRLIAEKNPGLDPARLTIGQRIVLPSRASVEERVGREAREAAAAATTPAPATRPGERVHTVVSGDTLSSIAARYLGGEQHWKLIADRNRDLLGGDADRLAVGMKLRIPRAPAD
jgi:nucleoid-associated protein YgaU